MEALLSYVNTKRIDILKNATEDTIDEVATEVYVNIYIDGILKDVLTTSPYKLLELGLGYALTHGLYVNESNVCIADLNIVLRNVIKADRKCGGSKNIRIDVSSIFKIFGEVMGKAILFKRTGCFHIAAIATPSGEIVDHVEDVSRHCALYKVIGSAYRKGIDLSETVLIMSSRVTLDLMRSIANVCIPIAIFRGAPTLNAIEVAREASITLIAHVRGGRANVYSEVHRILP